MSMRAMLAEEQDLNELRQMFDPMREDSQI